jgi:hypothetical protein
VFLGIYISVHLHLPSLSLLCFFSAPPRRRCTGHVPCPTAPEPLRGMPRVFPCLAAVFSASRWPAPTSPTLRRRCPSRHACRRHRPLLLARATPLLALRRAQLLLCDLLYPPKHLQSTAIPLPELSPSPDHRRHPWPPSTATTATPHFRSKAQIAPPRPTEAHRANQSQFLPLE